MTAHAADARVVLGLPDGWFAVPLDAADRLRSPAGTPGATLLEQARVALAGWLGPLQTTAAAAAVYDVAGEITVGSALAGWWPVNGESAADADGVVASLAAVLPAVSTGGPERVRLPVGPALRWRSPSVDGSGVTYAVPLPELGAAAVVAFAAFGARPEAVARHFERFAGSLGIDTSGARR